MATAPFGGVLEGQLKEAEQGGLFHVNEGFIVTPQAFCCVSGTSVGVLKDPVGLLILDKQMACVNEAVTVDYSGSWSPSGTINTWAVDWGDGNASGGAFPGAGSVAHPGGGGGYAFPGIYTIELTVTDLLGAVGTTEVQIEIVDCTLIPDIEAFCGCGASGVWYTITGGRLWELRGLDGIEIYDLKAVYFSIGHPERRLWAATAEGLFKSEDDGNNWTLFPLPDDAQAVAISPSRLLTDELFVAANVAGLAPRLYKTGNNGLTWESVQLRLENWTEVPNGLGNDVLAIGYRQPSRLFAGGSQAIIASGCDPFNSIADWLNPGPWGPANDGLDNIVNAIEVTPGNVLYAAGVFLNSCAAPVRLVARWTGVGGGWAQVGVFPASPEVDDLAWDDANGLLYAGCVAGVTVCQVWNGIVWASVGGADELNGSVRAVAVNQDGIIDPIGTVYAGGVFQDTLLGTVVRRIGKWDGANWTQIGGGLNGTVNDIQIGADGYLYISGSFTIATQPDATTFAANRVVRWNGTEFEALGDGFGATVYALAIDDTGRVYAGGLFTTLGDVAATACLRVGAYDGNNWAQVGDGFNATVRSMYWSPLQQRIYAGGDFTQSGAANVDHIGFLTFTNYTLPTIGRTHIVDVDAGDSFVYVGVLNGGFPRILRVRPTMDQDPVVIYANAAGTWGGVRADWNLIGRVWYFGDFGAATKVLLSENFGTVEVDLTDAGWGAGEVVRPVMPSVYNPSDVIAILNTALDAFESKDDGTTWAKTGDTNFDAACGERDWIDPRGVFIGNVGPAPTGAQHLRYTLNRGIAWLERSTAITADAPIVAIQIVG